MEFALILPLLALLLFGIIEFGVTYNNWISIRQGTREGARQGIVAATGTDTTCLHSGTTGSTNIKELMCLTKNRIGISANDVYVMVSFDPNYAKNNGLLVCTQYPVKSFTGLFSPFLNNRFLKTKVEMNIEQLTGTAETVGFEPPPSGSNWTWCNPSDPSP